jgi:hypothetical protein
MMVRNEILLFKYSSNILFLGKRIYQQFQSSLENIGNDIHSKLMSQYPEVSSWWYVEK